MSIFGSFSVDRPKSDYDEGFEDKRYYSPMYPAPVKEHLIKNWKSVCFGLMCYDFKKFHMDLLNIKRVGVYFVNHITQEYRNIKKIEHKINSYFPNNRTIGEIIDNLPDM